MLEDRDAGGTRLSAASEGEELQGMGETHRFLGIPTTLRAIPDSAIACVGFGLLLLSWESNRLPAIQTVAAAHDGTLPLSALPAIALLLVAAFLGSHLATLHVRNVAALLAGGIQMVSMLGSWEQLAIVHSPVVANLCDAAFDMSFVTMFFFWAKRIFPHGTSTTAEIYAVSIIVSGASCALLTMARAEAAVGIIAIAPPHLQRMPDSFQQVIENAAQRSSARTRPSVSHPNGRIKGHRRAPSIGRRDCLSCRSGHFVCMLCIHLRIHPHAMGWPSG